MTIEMRTKAPNQPAITEVLDAAIKAACGSFEIKGSNCTVALWNPDFAMRHTPDGEVESLVEDQITGLKIKSTDGTVRTLLWRGPEDNRGRTRRLTDAVKGALNPTPRW